MKFQRDSAQLFVPDGLPAGEALARITSMGVAAHPDDLEIMATAPILDGFTRRDRSFCGVVVTDGGGSPRTGPYAECSDQEMRTIRREEQKRAAVLGGYGILVLLDYPSEAVKDPSLGSVARDLKSLLSTCRPRQVFTHNLADKHDTHVAVVLRVLEALRALPAAGRPEHVYGCEVWRDLDWLPDEDKVVFDLSEKENLQAALLGVFDSQLSGGKRYDLATLGRRRANATFLASHAADTATSLGFAMDLMPLVLDPTLEVGAFLRRHLDHFREDVELRLARLRSSPA